MLMVSSPLALMSKPVSLKHSIICNSLLQRAIWDLMLSYNLILYVSHILRILKKSLLAHREHYILLFRSILDF